MFTVAIIGPDGAGKSTVIEAIEHDPPYPMRRIYMGVNPDSLTHMLPTTRLVNYIKQRKSARVPASQPATVGQGKKKARSTGNAGLQFIKSLLFVMNRFGEAWYRQMVCWYYLRKGYIVLFDRHFYLDHLAFEFAHPDVQRPFLRRIYDRLLEKTYPRPDLTIYLDAPPEILFSRKREGTLEGLQQMRSAYLQIAECMPTFRVVNTVKSPDLVLQNVVGHIKLYRKLNRR